MRLKLCNEIVNQAHKLPASKQGKQCRRRQREGARERDRGRVSERESARRRAFKQLKAVFKLIFNGQMEKQ